MATATQIRNATDAATRLGAEQIEATYRRRQERLEHPDGQFDRAGRFYPSAIETRSCCHTVRQPTRSYPYSLMLHCRTRSHIRRLHTEGPAPEVD